MIHTIRSETPKSSEISYPCLMKSYKSEAIWLMASERKGTVVSVGNGPWEAGETCSRIPMNTLTLYNGDVTLRNKG